MDKPIERVEISEAIRELLLEILLQNRQIIDANCYTMRILSQPANRMANLTYDLAAPGEDHPFFQFMEEGVIVEKPTQRPLMLFDPSNGGEVVHPTDAGQWREYHGKLAWLYNPWSGQMRDPEEIGRDPFGHLIVPPKEEVSPAPLHRPHKKGWKP